MALQHMSDKGAGELTSAKEICALYKAPFDVTSRVLQILTQNQILKSEHGAHGGYLIQKDLARLTLLDLSEMILGPVQVANCLHDGAHRGVSKKTKSEDHGCDQLSHCNIITPLVKLNDQIKTFYNTISIKNLLLSRSSKKMPRTEMEFTV